MKNWDFPWDQNQVKKSIYYINKIIKNAINTKGKV